MSRKKSASVRMARSLKSKAKKKESIKEREKSGAINMASTTPAQRRRIEIAHQKGQLSTEIFGLIQTKVLRKVSDELYAGTVEYLTLRPTSKEAAQKIQYEIEKALAPIQAIPKEQHTKETVSQASEILAGLHKGFMEAGMLKPEYPNLLQRLPDVLRFMDGRIEIIDKVNDMDHALIAQYATEETRNFNKHRTIPAMKELLAQLKEEVPMPSKADDPAEEVSA